MKFQLLCAMNTGEQLSAEVLKAQVSAITMKGVDGDIPVEPVSFEVIPSHNKSITCVSLILSLTEKKTVNMFSQLSGDNGLFVYTNNSTGEKTELGYTYLEDDEKCFILPEAGDIVSISMEPSEDQDLFSFLCDYKDKLIVTEADHGSGLIWIKDCPYAISMALIETITQPVCEWVYKIGDVLETSDYDEDQDILENDRFIVTCISTDEEDTQYVLVKNERTGTLYDVPASLLEPAPPNYKARIGFNFSADLPIGVTKSIIYPFVSKITLQDRLSGSDKVFDATLHSFEILNTIPLDNKTTITMDVIFGIEEDIPDQFDYIGDDFVLTYELNGQKEEIECFYTKDDEPPVLY